tara:strand:+ start:4403 stop:4798 length:396 start_codon:yes stop_codon:yes gene_type:complete
MGKHYKQMSIIKLAPYLHEKLNKDGSNALDELKLYNETIKNDINNGHFILNDIYRLQSNMFIIRDMEIYGEYVPQDKLYDWMKYFLIEKVNKKLTITWDKLKEMYQGLGQELGNPLTLYTTNIITYEDIYD